MTIGARSSDQAPSRRNTHSRRLRVAVAAGLASFLLLVSAVAALRPFRDELSTGTPALVLLLPPLAASYAGRRVSIFMATLSALAFNFYFTRPYGSLRIDESASVAAFLVYMVVAVVLAAVVNRFREAHRTADERSRDTQLLQSLTVELIRNDELEPTVRSMLRDLVSALDLRGAALRVTIEHAAIEADAGEAERCTDALDALNAPQTSARLVTLRGHDGLVTVPVVTVEAIHGFLVVDVGAGREVSRETLGLTESFAAVLGLAIGRVGLQRKATRGQVLEDTDRLRTALLQSVSHDLRTPLTAIKAAASLLRGEAPESARDALLADIELEADRLHRLVANMLDLSRIEGGALRPRRTLMPVAELVDAAVEDAASATGNDRVRVDLNDVRSPVAVDETMMRQVIVNLLDNAAKAGPSDSPIVVRVREHAGMLTLEIVDRGPGIPEAERRRVFEPYQRLRAERNRWPGTGLGLAISRGFVEAHGGTLRVDPTPGGGATFVVEIPLDRAA